jgi:hypothetical protein
MTFGGYSSVDSAIGSVHGWPDGLSARQRSTFIREKRIGHADVAFTMSQYVQTWGPIAGWPTHWLS